MSIAILYLTDMHISSEVNSNPVLERSEAIIDCTKYLLARSDELIILVGGDIAASGKETEYDNAYIFLDDIKSAFEQHLDKSVQLLAVPGNHDCNFDNDQSLRNRLLDTISIDNIDIPLVAETSKVQHAFFEFTQNFTLFDSDALCTKCDVLLKNKRFLFLLVNSSWMSQRKEQPGRLILPVNLLPNDIELVNYDCVISLMHHPHNWFHPDNSTQLQDYFRRTTDILIFGHEHREDSSEQIGASWSMREYRGVELQDTKENSSGFSFFKFDDDLQHITEATFSWMGTGYTITSQTNNIFGRNVHAIELMLKPTSSFTNGTIEDPGILINHPNGDNIKLSEIYIWPELDKLEYKNESTIIRDATVKNNISQEVLSKKYAVVFGEALSGKTSLAKMLFKSYTQHGDCCVLIDGKDLNSTNAEILREKIEQKVMDQYSGEAIDKYRRLSIEARTIIIDNGLGIPYRDDRIAKVFDYLDSVFSHIIIFADNEIETRVRFTKLPPDIINNISYYGIRNLGNTKRHELISKWYGLRNEYASSDPVVETKVLETTEKIDSVLGSNHGFLPALPVYIIGLLQNVDSAMPASFSGSEYGFLYDSLINKSLSTLNYSTPGDLNIDINALSSLAFYLLAENTYSFSTEEFHKVSDTYAKKKRVSIRPDAILKKMISVRLIEDLGGNTYRFRYPYVFYYFSGRYIAYNLTEETVQNQIDTMCHNLHNEKYGNIIIFLCHFANNKDIIDRIVDVSCTSLMQYEVFSFDKHSDIFDKAGEMINKIISEVDVGSESDVDANRQKELERRDNAGIRDGSVHEVEEIDEEKREKDMAELAAAMRTIDVLGQIIKNYPGDIDGDVKEIVINEIYSLGMRITEALISTVGVLEEDFLKYLIERAQATERSPDPEILKQSVHKLFVIMIANMTMSMIQKISAALCNPALLTVVDETYSKSPSLAHKLILAELKFNRLKRPDIDRAIRLNEELQKSGATAFANSVLRSIVIRYLRYNNCGTQNRNRLCAKFDLSSKKLLIENAKKG